MTDVRMETKRRMEINKRRMLRMVMKRLPMEMGNMSLTMKQSQDQLRPKKLKSRRKMMGLHPRETTGLTREILPSLRTRTRRMSEPGDRGLDLEMEEEWEEAEDLGLVNTEEDQGAVTEEAAADQETGMKHESLILFANFTNYYIIQGAETGAGREGIGKIEEKGNTESKEIERDVAENVTERRGRKKGREKKKWHAS